MTTINFLDKWALNRVENLATETEMPGFTSDDINTFLTSIRNGGAVGDNLSETTYLTCIKTLYETLGKLNIDLQEDTKEGTRRLFDHEVVPILRRRTNPHLTPSTFKQLMEFNRNHYGNAYAYINRNLRTGKLESLVPLHPPQVKLLVDDQGLLGIKNTVMYRCTDPKRSTETLFSEKDILHFKFSLLSEDGLVGRSVQEVLATTLEGSHASQGFLNNLYQNGMTASAALEYVGDLDARRVKELKSKIEEYAIGAENAGRVIPLPPGTKLTPLNLKLAESQFFELRKYSSLQIASVFGVKPVQLNDYEKASYSSSESQNLSFYVDTMLAILKQYEEELDYKLLSESDIKSGVHHKFNVSSMLRADLKTQSETLTRYVNNAIMTPNEARNKLDLLEDEHGDSLMANGNYIKLKQVGAQYPGGDPTSRNTGTSDGESK